MSDACMCCFIDACSGTGVIHCSPPCGGDLCICVCGGETDCGGCAACRGLDDFCDDEPVDLEDRLDAALRDTTHDETRET